MSDTLVSWLVFYAWLCGILVGYIWWAPNSKFKQSFIDGLSLRFLWGRKP